MSRRLRSIGIIGVVALLAMFALLPVAGAAPRAAETTNVSAKDFEVDPKTITVNVGETIAWKNDVAVLHTADADNETTFDSGDLAAGATFSHTFEKAGTF